jgi:hypothetical protein
VATKRASQGKVCGAKRRFLTLEDAVRAALTLNREEHARGKVRMGAYRCPFCRQFHIGHFKATGKKAPVQSLSGKEFAELRRRFRVSDRKG